MPDAVLGWPGPILLHRALRRAQINAAFHYSRFAVFARKIVRSLQLSREVPPPGARHDLYSLAPTAGHPST